MSNATGNVNGAARETAQGPYHLPHTVERTAPELERAVNAWAKVRAHPLVPRDAVNAVNDVLCYLTRLEARIQQLEGATNGVKAPHPGKNEVP